LGRKWSGGTVVAKLREQAKIEGSDRMRPNRRSAFPGRKRLYYERNVKAHVFYRQCGSGAPCGLRCEYECGSEGRRTGLGE
jgi:hypothetical protein